MSASTTGRWGVVMSAVTNSRWEIEASALPNTAARRGFAAVGMDPSSESVPPTGSYPINWIKLELTALEEL